MMGHHWKSCNLIVKLDCHSRTLYNKSIRSQPLAGSSIVLAASFSVRLRPVLLDKTITMITNGLDAMTGGSRIS